MVLFEEPEVPEGHKNELRMTERDVLVISFRSRMGVLPADFFYKVGNVHAFMPIWSQKTRLLEEGRGLNLLDDDAV